MGALWQIVVFLYGVLPTVVAVTGLLIWLHSRRTEMSARTDIAAVLRIDAAA